MKGLVCSAHEVRGLQKGAVSLLVRPIKPQPQGFGDDWYPDSYNNTADWCFWGKHGTAVHNKCGLPLFRNPFGKPGDRLWVKETWACVHGAEGDPQPHDFVRYRADDSAGDLILTLCRGWKQSNHMPHAYSRLTLQLSEVRVEKREEGWVWLLSVSVVPQDSKESE